MTETIRTLKAEAKAAGVTWAEIKDAYAEVKQAEWAKRERPDAIRREAWAMEMAGHPRSHAFWRHGFLSKYGRKLAKGADHTIVPGYDDMAQELAAEFPEFDNDHGTEDLFELLLSPREPMPRAEQLYREAFELAEYRKATQPAATESEVPF